MITTIRVITEDERLVLREADVAYMAMVGTVFGTDGKAYYLTGEDDNGWLFAEVSTNAGTN